MDQRLDRAKDRIRMHAAKLVRPEDFVYAC